MNVEKIVRVLGYTVYLILWLPLIVALFPVVLIAMLVTFLRADMPVKDALQLIGKSLKSSWQHDAYFIKTGIWL